ncbi:hypothetical protein EAE99_008102 [Botrytis elliptica]|nr:hypothetical protein EAE99_008102 [Botrytis elliptica]
MAREKWTKKTPKGGDAPKSQPQNNKSDNKPNDDEVLGLCKILLPEIQEVIKKGVVPHDSILHSVFRNTLCTAGVVPVIRSLTAKDNPASAEMTHPEGVTVNKLTTAVVDLFNENIVRKSVINHVPEPLSHSSEPSDDKGRSLAMIESQKHMRLEFLVTSANRKVPVELPLNERIVFIMKEHETSDEPYLTQSDFPEYISISEEVLMRACPFIRAAFSYKDMGKFDDPGDICIYDPAFTAHRKRCVAQRKLVYLSDLVHSSFRGTAKHLHSVYDLKKIDKWTADTFWKHTKSWILFLRGNDFSENISSTAEMDEVCMLAAFLGAKNNATTALRNTYQHQKDRATREKLHPRPQTLLKDEPGRKRSPPERAVRKSDYVANDTSNEMLGNTGWRSRDD